MSESQNQRPEIGDLGALLLTELVQSFDDPRFRLFQYAFSAGKSLIGDFLSGLFQLST